MTDEGIHHIVSDMVPMVIIVSLVITSAWVLKLIVGAFRSRSLLKAQSEFHNKMLDKFSSAEEFTAYLKSDAGQSFFEKLSVEPATPLTKILNSIQTGAILTLLGLGMYFMTNVFDSVESHGVLLILATVVFTIGLGFLISSGVSYYLAKSWGIISPGNVRNETDSKPAAQ